MTGHSFDARAAVRLRGGVLAPKLTSPMITLSLTRAQYDHVLAGVRMLATAVDDGTVTADDNDIGQIMTNGGEHPAMTSDEIHDMADGWQTGDL